MRNSKDKITVKELVNFSKENKTLDLKAVSKSCDLKRTFFINQINRPGLNLFGFFKHFAYERIQVFGQGEYSFLKLVEKKNQQNNLPEFFKYPIPCIIFTHNNEPPDFFLKLANENETTVFITKLSTSDLIQKLNSFFLDCITIRKVVHGSMLEIFGIGVFLKGESHIGVSECTLELIERNHCFIADDLINVKLQRDGTILAYSSNLTSHYMEIKGIGIINVAHLFGIRAILKSKVVNLIVELERFDSKKEYDISGIDLKYETMLGVALPKVTIPFSSGVNLPILVETATMNHRLKMTGYNTAKEFNKKIISSTLAKKNQK